MSGEKEWFYVRQWHMRRADQKEKQKTLNKKQSSIVKQSEQDGNNEQ
jgi:hypothetical protein